MCLYNSEEFRSGYNIDFSKFTTVQRKEFIELVNKEGNSLLKGKFSTKEEEKIFLDRLNVKANEKVKSSIG